MEFYLALKRVKLDSEMHIYATGGHGFGVKQEGPIGTWPKTCEHWLRQKGILKK